MNTSMYTITHQGELHANSIFNSVCMANTSRGIALSIKYQAVLHAFLVDEGEFIIQYSNFSSF